MSLLWRGAGCAKAPSVKAIGVDKQGGFTLIEILAVVLVIALGVSIVTMNIGGGNDAFQLRVDARQFTNNVSMVAGEAVMSRHPWGVEIFRSQGEAGIQYGYRWMAQIELPLAENSPPGTRPEKQWLALAPRDMDAEVLLSLGRSLRLELEGELQEIEWLQEDSGKDGPKPTLYFFNNSEITPFILTFYNEQDPDIEVVVEGDALGRLKLLDMEQESEL